MDGNPRAVINCWRNASNHTPTAELVADRTFHHAVLTRLRQTERPLDLKALAAKLLKKASKTKTPTSSKGMNGVTLDQKGKASLESLILHYAMESPACSRKRPFKLYAASSPIIMGRNFMGLGRKPVSLNSAT